ncbi:putative ABC transporter ATP-binding protein YbhF [Chlamydiales bacterium STE3]|nr:putative ABC transporter ATP-binding protein YbhF [Chlamydiales bacterium STE3]
MNEALVTIQNVSKVYGNQTVLSAINAIIPKGEMVALAGPDGAGKTTLIRLMAGLLLPSTGSINVDGYDSIKEADHLHQIIGYMPQKFGLYEDLTVIQNLNLFADLRAVPKEEKETTYKRLLSFTNLASFQDRLVGALSGGMKQKLGLACALVCKPTLLLLDEPSVGVDPISRRELWQMVYDLLQEGISVIWSTAYLDEAQKSHTVLLLNEGKLLYAGSPQKMTERVEGRAFLISDIRENRRNVLTLTLRQPNVIDGVIQGEDVRFVTKDPMPMPFAIANVKAGSQAKIVKTAPRFEDAFIDILGGGPGGYSKLAERIPRIAGGGKAVIQAERLVKLFGNFVAADDITFTIKSGEIFGLLGPNGAGKSTTFKMLCGLLKPNSGRALVNGLDLQMAPSQARSQIGYMAQKFSLYGDLNVWQNLDFFSGIYNLQGKEKKKTIDEMITIFDLKPYIKEIASTLPLGFKQRLSLACAVMHHPEVLFLDEPTSGVDPITRREFWNHINGLVEKGVTVMVTTHFMDEAEYCDRIGLVYQGKLIKLGTPEALKKEARTEQNLYPSLEEAFIQLIENYGSKNNPR